MAKALLVYPEKCTGCRVCELICSFHHHQEINPLRSSIRLIKNEKQGIDIPVLCLHCTSPPCMNVCPVEAIKVDLKTNSVKLDTNECIGCKLCLMICPIGAITIDPILEVPIKCDLCGGEPKCVKYCETGALVFEDLSKIPVHLKIRKKSVSNLQKLLASLQSK